MFFRIVSTTPSMDLAKLRAKRNAYIQLALYQKGVTEVLLDRYLRENYKISLYEACKKILHAARFSLNMQQEIIVTIPEETTNKLARIITYGTGKLVGSNILRNMFYIGQ